MKIRKIGKIPTDEDLKLHLNQRVIPVKFCYLEKGGNKWHELRQDKSYKLGKRELKALKEGLKNIENIIGKEPINLIHIGPGDGIEIPILFEKFKQRDNEKYAGVDINEQMIKNTLKLNKSYFSRINPLWYLTDIETEGNLELVCKDVRNKGADRNLLIASNEGTLLSNNFIFRYLRNSMNKKDFLFLTLEGDEPNKRDEILATYNLQEVKDLLSVGLKRASYTAEAGSFRTSFNEFDSRVEIYFKPKNEPEILCLASYKPREDEFRKRLIDFGFNIQYLKFYKDIHSFAVLCKRGRKNV